MTAAIRLFLVGDVMIGRGTGSARAFTIACTPTTCRV